MVHRTLLLFENWHVRHLEKQQQYAPESVTQYESDKRILLVPPEKCSYKDKFQELIHGHYFSNCVPIYGSLTW